MPFTLNFTGTRITDSIVGALSTSLAAYNAAATDELVAITAAEYTALQTAVAGVTKTSMEDTAIDASTGALAQSASTVYRTVLAGGTASLMIAGYTFAARARIVTTSGSVQNGVAVGSGFQLGYSTTATGTGVAVSGIYGTSATTDSNGFVYFVVKSPSVVAPAGAMPTIRGSSIATYGIAIGGTGLSAPFRYTTGAADVTAATTAAIAGSRHPAFQYLQTPTKQW